MKKILLFIGCAIALMSCTSKPTHVNFDSVTNDTVTDSVAVTDSTVSL